MTPGPSADLDRHKREMREAVRQRLAAMSPAHRDAGSAAACERVWEFLQGRAVAGWRERGVMLYAPFSTELDVGGLADRLLRLGVPVFLPLTAGEKMRPALVSGWVPIKAHTGPGPYQPGPGAAEQAEGAPSGPEVVVVPGLAFDPSGGRLGRGRGFYDRFLAQQPAGHIAVGVAFDEQVVDSVPRGPHDSGVCVVITPTRLLRS
ncbi:MAG: 5-formyltetrahydrofolate cyclo-ligase [Phycisphaeraceae bacterium]|nr:5-formyltetrahydrofolate cyclo-ligase [Phycisphaeraceae bacterium]